MIYINQEKFEKEELAFEVLPGNDAFVRNGLWDTMWASIRRLVHVVFHGPGHKVTRSETLLPAQIVDSVPRNALRMPPLARRPHP